MTEQDREGASGSGAGPRPGAGGDGETSRWSTETDGPSATARADAMGATVIAYLVTGPALFGAIGYGLDRLLGTGFLVAVGIVAGMGLSLYTIWLRYGTS